MLLVIWAFDTCVKRPDSYSHVGGIIMNKRKVLICLAELVYE